MKQRQAPQAAKSRNNIVIRRIQRLIYVSLIVIGFGLTHSLYSDTNEPIKTLSGNVITKAEIDAFIGEEMDSLNIKGLSVAVINNGKIAYQGNYGVKSVETQEPVDSQTMFEAASIGKPVFAWFVMKQVEKGLLDLGTPLHHYLPYPDIEHDEKYKSITARMVLSHRSGFCNLRYFNPDLNLDIKFAPGSDFLYSGEGYDYLSKVVAHLNDLDVSNLDSLFQREVTEPLKIPHAYFQMNDYTKSHLASAHQGDSLVYADYWDRNIFSSSGGLHTDANSYARFIIEIMNHKGLTGSSYKELLREHVILDNDDWEKIELGYSGWSLGFGIIDSEYGVNYTHIGNNLGYTTGILFNKSSKFGYVYLTNSDQRNDLINNFKDYFVR